MNELYTVLFDEAQLIIDNTVRYFHLTRQDIYSPSQEMDVATARQVACYLMRQRQGAKLTFLEIGNLLGYRDHSSAIHNNRLVKGYLDTGHLTAGQLAAIRRGEVCPCIDKYRRKSRKQYELHRRLHRMSIDNRQTA